MVKDKVAPPKCLVFVGTQSEIIAIQSNRTISTLVLLKIDMY